MSIRWVAPLKVENITLVMQPVGNISSTAGEASHSFGRWPSTEARDTELSRDFARVIIHTGFGPLWRALAQSESKAQLSQRLGLLRVNGLHKKVYAMTKVR